MTNNFSHNDIVPLWAAGAVPQSLGTTDADDPTLTLFLPAELSGKTPAIIICPGGGYRCLAFEHEGVSIGEWFQARGIAAFVLKYRLPTDGYRHPIPLLDLQRAMRVVRSGALALNINPAQVGAMGFSAGGHLVSTLEVRYDAGNASAADPVDRQGCRPDFAVLVYPVITLKGAYAHVGSRTNLLGPDPDLKLVDSLCNQTQVTAQTPPTVLVHAKDDTSVSIVNSEIMFTALQRARVPASLQVYSMGGHGFGYGSSDPVRKPPEGWLDHVYSWLKDRDFGLEGMT